MKERHLKINEAPGQKRNIPRINLQGDWLSNLGYHVGDHVIISYDQGKLTVELDPVIPADANS
nr:MAG TPA: Toxin SymE, type I toxin-antitoxin system [Caudoviricetes sp.]